MLWPVEIRGGHLAPLSGRESLSLLSSYIRIHSRLLTVAERHLSRVELVDPRCPQLVENADQASLVLGTTQCSALTSWTGFPVASNALMFSIVVAAIARIASSVKKA